MNTKPEDFINRELSWIEFNQRVLDKARDKNTPIFERAKFLAISATNLDEFIQVRIASLKDMEHAGYKKKDISGMDPTEQLEAVGTRLEEFIKKQYSVFKNSLLPKFKEEGLCEFVTPDQLTKDEKELMDKYFLYDVYPVLSPMAVDYARPFPHIKSNILHMAVMLKNPMKEVKKKKDKYDLAIIEISPLLLSRVVDSSKDNESGEGIVVRKFTMIEDIIAMYLDQIFAPNEIIAYGTFRIIRNGDLPSDVEEAEDLLKEIENKLKKRKWGEVIHLEYSSKMDKRILNRLKKELKVKNKDVYRIKGPIDLSFIAALDTCFKEDKDKLGQYFYVPFTPPQLNISPAKSMLDFIREGDFMSYYPYDDYESDVVRFITDAAADPDVVSIRQTLYRVSDESPIVKALMNAAESGKQVVVLVELQARFDEASNIIWAKRLENAGAHVIYGYGGMKTHAKLCAVVRNENGHFKYYSHIGTGNYNEKSAKIYTDLSLFTADDTIGEIIGKLFNALSGFSGIPDTDLLLIAPNNLKKKILELIQREIIRTKDSNGDYIGRIIMKCNSLSDKEIITALYEASAAGVQIDLIVRGICCLKPHVYDLSDNITVRSIVGRFLEHARIYSFGAGCEPDIYIGSADMMPRNLDHRIETLVKLTEPAINKYAQKILAVQLKDNMNAKVMRSDGTYKKVQKRGNPLDCHDPSMMEGL